LLALLGAHHILHISGLRVKAEFSVGTFLGTSVTQELSSLWLKSIKKRERKWVFISVFKKWQRHFWITVSCAISSMKKFAVIKRSCPLIVIQVIKRSCPLIVIQSVCSTTAARASSPTAKKD
jgi:hypothetical protein